MSNNTYFIHNVETDNIGIFELTDKEEAILNDQREKALLAKAKAQAESAAAKEAAETKLAAFGLTLSDLKALGL